MRLQTALTGFKSVFDRPRVEPIRHTKLGINFHELIFFYAVFLTVPIMRISLTYQDSK